MRRCGAVKGTKKCFCCGLWLCPDHVHAWEGKKPEVRKVPQERIISAAVWVDDGNEHLHQPTATGFVVGGWRHHNILSTIHCTNPTPRREDMVQGFLTTRGRFVDRVAALKIARQEGQLIGPERGDALYSEDIY